MTDPREPESTGAAGDGREERALGPTLIARLGAALRGLRLYTTNNPMVHQLVSELHACVMRAMSEDVTLVGLGDHFYLNGVRLRPASAQVAMFRALMTEFESRGIGGLRFEPGLEPKQLEAFLRMVLGTHGAQAGAELPEKLADSGLRHVAIILADDLQTETEAADSDSPGTPGERQRAQRTFWRAVAGTRDLMVSTARSGRPALRHARRLVQPIVDSLMKNEYSILGLTALKDHDEYTYAHCVNVSVLSIGVGQALGLPRAILANLGVAGLLHDVGKIAVPLDVLQKPGSLSPEEWLQIRRHPIEGMKMVARMPGLSGLSVDAMRTCFQHHMTMTRGGYPQITKARPPSPLPRIVSVADFFDAMTAHRAYRKRPLSSFEALQMLLGPERENFDPIVLWALARCVGLYPAGTVMITDSNHVVLSLSPNQADLRRPHVRVLLRPDGSTPPDDEPELWEPMPAHETVRQVVQPEDQHLPSGALLAA